MTAAESESAKLPAASGKRLGGGVDQRERLGTVHALEGHGKSKKQVARSGVTCGSRDGRSE